MKLILPEPSALQLNSLLADITSPLLREWGAGLHDLECKVDPKTRTKPETATSAETTESGKVEQKPAAKTGKVKLWKIATIRQAVIVIRGFINWRYEEKLITHDLAKALKIPKSKRRMQRTLNGDEIQALLGACDTQTEVTPV